MAINSEELGTSINYAMKVWNDTNYATALAYEDKMLYDVYKNQGISCIEDEKIVDIIVLEKLEKLGLPMNGLGTYLYKDLVMKAYSEVVSNDVRNDKSLADSLLLRLNYRLSNFYHELARNDLDMGVKTFHQYINMAFTNIDDSRIDEKVVKDIFGSTIPSSYGTQAFKIAIYLDKEYSDKNIFTK